MSPPLLAKEIRKRRPFDVPEEEAYLNLWRTYTVLAEGVERLLRSHGLCPTHYNILRILAGEQAAGVSGLPVLEVRQRLITRVPDITRLVDRLVELRLAERVRTDKDRRLVMLSITPRGSRLLADILRPLQDLHRTQFAGLSPAELGQLSDLLEKPRMVRK